MELSERNRRISEWEKTKEYELQFKTYQTAAERLLSTIEQYRSTLLCDTLEFENQSVRTEVASNGDLHRGYYCPSLTYDLVVGGVKRGKLLKRLTKRSKTYFLYGFDKTDRLIWCKYFVNYLHIKTEYLIYQGNHIYGLTISANGEVEAVTEEKYSNGKIESYCYILMFPSNVCSEWVEMRKEIYSYDTQGLYACDWYSMFPLIHDLRHERITFERVNGFLTKHYWETIIGVETEQVVQKSALYDVLAERTA